jgi:hypothetical protein
MRGIALYRGFHLQRTPVRGSRSAPAGAQASILRRIFAGIDRWEQRRAEREAARFIADHGGRFTDDIERRLFERLAGGRGFGP